MKILAFGDLMGNSEFLHNLLRKDLSSYDFALFTGDIPNPEVFKKLSKKLVEKGLGDLGGKPNIAKETEPKEALKQVEKEFEKIKGLFKKTQKRVRFIGVWGNADNRKILRKVPIENFIEIIHNKIVQIGEYYLIGYNGRPLYFFEKENKDQWAFSEEEVYNDLARLLKGLDKKRTILLTHIPSYGTLDRVVEEYRAYGVGTYGERANEGHIGSIGLKRAVDKYRPALHIFGHIHEGKGMAKNKTVSVNTGSAGEEGDIVKVNVDSSGIKVIFKKV